MFSLTYYIFIKRLHSSLWTEKFICIFHSFREKWPKINFSCHNFSVENSYFQISWLLFHLIWKNYVLYIDFDSKSWIVAFSLFKKDHKTNFSCHNFSVENNYCLLFRVSLFFSLMNALTRVFIWGKNKAAKNVKWKKNYIHIWLFVF